MQYSKDEIERVLLTDAEIQRRLDELAARINADYAGHDLLVVCILKGAVAVFADLLRRLTIPCSIDFMAISSYGSSTKSSGVVRILQDLAHGIEGKNLRTRGPASLKLFTLLDKPERRRVELTADYIGFTIPDEFVVGYGLDYAEHYRNLPDVCILSPKMYS